MFNILDPERVKASPGDVLINAGACFPDLEALKRSFDIMIFLDFCVGLEAAVLHNTLHCMGQAFGEPNPALTTLVSTGLAQQYDRFFPHDRAGLGNLQSRMQQSDLLRRVGQPFPMRPIDPHMIPTANPPKPALGESMEDFARRLREYAMTRVRDVQSKMETPRPENVPPPIRWELMAASWQMLNLVWP